MASDVVPVIDLAAARSSLLGRDAAQTAEAIDAACYKCGFFIVSGHGISDELIAESRRLSIDFFRQPEEAKRLLHLPGRGRGYIPFESERLGATIGDQGPGDLKESFNFCADFEANVWPANTSEFRQILEGLFQEMLLLTNLLMKLCAAGLKLPENFFDEYTRNPKATLRLSYYPAVSEVKDGQVRVSSHTDYGTLTLLSPDPRVGGLQILYRGEEWIDVDNPPGTFVVNIGDIMDIWTNGKWKPTYHRVIIPPNSDLGQQERLSLVFLHNPNPEAIISPVASCISAKFPSKYSPIVAGEHLKAKSQKSRGEAIPARPA
jgi:isopenicillin N synthase-like dioxygenase